MPLYSFQNKDNEEVYEEMDATPAGARRKIAKRTGVKPSRLLRLYHHPAGVVFTTRNTRTGSRDTSRRSTWRS